MASTLEDEDHRGVYIFTPQDEADPAPTVAGVAAGRSPSAKRRKVTCASHERKGRQQAAKKDERASASTGSGKAGRQTGRAKIAFPPLFDGAEWEKSVRRREGLFEEEWARIDEGVRAVLREANGVTLEGVCGFVGGDAELGRTKKMPAAFIITGPNISSQDLLFFQLAEKLQDDYPGRFVRLSSGEATNLKAALKKVIRGVTSSCRTSSGLHGLNGLNGEDVEDTEEMEVDGAVGQQAATGRRHKYLDYDLEALHVYLQHQEEQQQQSTKPHSRRVFVAFEDSEAFDSALLSDLITLFASWRDRIRFTLLFGVGTSVELFRARLPRSASHLLHGAQFDVVRASDVLERVVRDVIARPEGALLLGPAFLGSLLERQAEQVASVQMFVSSVKYAYMTHFYANPISVLLQCKRGSSLKGLLQPEHFEAIRMLPSFRREVEAAVQDGRSKQARSLLSDDDDFCLLSNKIEKQQCDWRRWATNVYKSVQLISGSGLVASANFTSLYVSAIAEGLDLPSGSFGFIEAVRRTEAQALPALIQKMTTFIRSDWQPEEGGEEAATDESGFEELASTLDGILEEFNALEARVSAKDGGIALRSKYSAQSKVLRTTVVAQKVQLSRDTAALTADDTEFTRLIDALTEALTTHLAFGPASEMFLHEAWVYDSKSSPHRGVFVPQPGATIERALLRPHDYLACGCCGDAEGGMASSLPATSILYHLYLEGGSLVNVADLWTAFSALVVEGDGEDGEDGEDGKEATEAGGSGCDERTALVLFYRGLAELRSMGFVQSTRKKEDHIAKLKWM